MPVLIRVALCDDTPLHALFLSAGCTPGELASSLSDASHPPARRRARGGREGDEAELLVLELQRDVLELKALFKPVQVHQPRHRVGKRAQVPVFLALEFRGLISANA